MKASARKSQLDQLESKLRTALRRETTNVIEIGGLLIKSSKLLKHGEWLGWLKDHFDLSQRTAHNYYSAAEYDARKGKLATVANLAPGLLYALAANHYNEQEEAAILAATHEGRVDQTRADAICQSLKPPAPAADNDDPADDSHDDDSDGGADDAHDDDAADDGGAEDAESTAILDGLPPDVPPSAPITPPPNIALHVFDQAVTALKQLRTKPAAQFASTVHSTSDLEGVESFIRAVADRASKGDAAEVQSSTRRKS
jgi:hypothetical protein